MRIHILGICGTFMGSLALLARSCGHEVTGVDAYVYPPMSTLLEKEGICFSEGYADALPDPVPDLVLVGNALSRGNPAVEAVLRSGIPYSSGPEWLSRTVLEGRWVLAVAGTHGKTTTTSMLAWILEDAGLDPGFLVGGEALNFGTSARTGSGPFFVIEADEYDTSFFDKRAKFVHYRPRTAILNNLEFDHADIYPDLAAIETQFHHLVRTVPDTGLLIRHAGSTALDRVLARGCWTPVTAFGPGGEWQVRLEAEDASAFSVWEDGLLRGAVRWQMSGLFNAENALAAILAARHAGVPVARSCAALASFAGVRRRLELRGTAAGVAVYDDFAHHPTAIAATIGALRSRMPEGQLLAVLEPRSNTMRLGVHQGILGDSLAGASRSFVYAPPGLGWDAGEVLSGRAGVFGDLDALVEAVCLAASPGDQILVMSNGDFGAIHGRILQRLALGEAGRVPESPVR